MIDDTPETVVAEAHPIRNSLHGSLLAHLKQQRLERKREAAVRASPGNVRGANLAAMPAPDPGNASANEASPIQKTMMLPDQIAKVMRGLVRGPAFPAAVSRPARAREAKLHAIALLVDEDAVELPGRGEARQLQEFRQPDDVAVHGRPLQAAGCGATEREARDGRPGLPPNGMTMPAKVHNTRLFDLREACPVMSPESQTAESRTPSKPAREAIQGGRSRMPET